MALILICIRNSIRHSPQITQCEYEGVTCATLRWFYIPSCAILWSLFHQCKPDFSRLCSLRDSLFPFKTQCVQSDSLQMLFFPPFSWISPPTCLALLIVFGLCCAHSFFLLRFSFILSPPGRFYRFSFFSQTLVSFHRSSSSVFLAPEHQGSVLQGFILSLSFFCIFVFVLAFCDLASCLLCCLSLQIQVHMPFSLYTPLCIPSLSHPCVFLVVKIDLPAHPEILHRKSALCCCRCVLLWWLKDNTGVLGVHFVASLL